MTRDEACSRPLNAATCSSLNAASSSRRPINPSRRPTGRILCLVIFAALPLLSIPDMAAAQTLYVVRGRSGSVTFTTRKPEGRSFQVFSRRGPAFSRFHGPRFRGVWRGKPVDSPYDDIIMTTAKTHSLDPALVKAVVHVESMFNPRAISPKGAMGLMQLMPGTASRFGVDKPYSPEDNVDGGVRYLRMLHDRYDGNVILALAAYNAGEGVVDRVKNVPPFAETQTYVKRVMRMRDLYRCALDGRKDC